MASLLAAQTGNFTSASTWKLVDATSELDSNVNIMDIANGAGSSSPTFTPGAITVDGVALKLWTIPNASGTLAVTLRNSTDAVDVTTVTINVTDLPRAASGSPNTAGWVLFKFSADQTLIAGKAYLIRATCSVNGAVQLLRNGTAGNFCRKLRTTTTQAPAANDHLVISDEFTSAGVQTDITVTMDNTSTTSFGPVVAAAPAPLEGIVVSGKASLIWGTASATNYYLRWKGRLLVAGGGTVSVGTSGARIPSDSTAILETACVANNDSNIFLFAGGTLNMYGPVKTSTRTTLTNTLAASGTSITVASTADWENGDELCFSASGPNVSTATHEKKTVSVVGSPTTATIAPASNAHTVTAQHVCYVGNLTRRVKFRNQNSSFGTSIYHDINAVLNMDYVEFLNYADAVSFGAGLYLNGYGAISITNCSMHVPVSAYTSVQITGNTRNYVFSGNVVYLNNSNALFQIDGANGVGTSRVTSDNYLIGMAGFNCTCPVAIADIEEFRGNVVSSKNNGGGSFALRLVFNVNMEIVESRFADNVVTSSGAAGLCIDSNTGSAGRYLWGVFKNATVVECAGNGIGPYNNPIGCENLWFKTLKAYGCANGFAIGLSCHGSILMTDYTAAGTTGHNQASAINMNSAYKCDITIDGGSFGVATGSAIAHSTGDIRFTYSSGQHVLKLRNVNLASTTKIAGLQTSPDSSLSAAVLCHNYNLTPGDHRSFFRFSTITGDSVIFRTAAPSERITPLTATMKSLSGERQATVSNGGTRTISVYVRKSVVGDAGGANYNGNQPRLIVRMYGPTGVTSDTVLATMSAAGGTWQQLSGTTIAAINDGVFKFFVDCDGTAGWINVDDITVT